MTKRFFSNDPEGSGFRLHDDSASAKAATEAALAEYREAACNTGWEDSVSQVCWGELREVATCTTRVLRPETSEEVEADVEHAWGDWSEICDYTLLPPDTEDTT
jgi:hypothetical protein